MEIAIRFVMTFIYGMTMYWVGVWASRRLKRKCDVCGRYFKIRKENTYRAFKPGGITFVRSVFDAVDCPHCGCQHLLNIREERMEENKQ